MEVSKTLFCLSKWFTGPGLCYHIALSW